MISPSPAGSIAYALWLRTWIILAASVASAFALNGIANSLGPVPRVVVGMAAAMAFIIGFALLVGAVTYGGADLSTTESIYPKHTFTFPVNTRTLVGVPMVYGSLVVSLFWLLLARPVFSPTGLKLPIVWPAVTLGALVAWVQAASWSPYRVPFARIAAIGGVLAVLMIVGLGGQLFHVNNIVVIVFSAAVAVLAYPVAMAGLAKARRGDGTGSSGPFVLREAVSPTHLPIVSKPFSSPAQAMFWFDLRRNIWYPGAAAIFFGGFGFFIAILSSHGPASTLLPKYIPPGAIAFMSILTIPAFIVMMHAVVFGKFDMWAKPLTFPAFVTTRPISTAAIVGGKLRAANAITALLWTETFLLLCGFLIFPHGHDSAHSWATFLWKFATSRNIAAASLMLILLAVQTWSTIARSLWVTVSDKLWIVHGLPTATWLGWGGLSWGAYRLSHDPHLRSTIVPWIGWLICAVAIVKVVFTLVVLLRIHRLSLMSWATILKAIGIWTAACLTLIVAIVFVFFISRHALLPVSSLVVLLVPLGRPALAVLALHYNRHQ
jgi:hypothetical protein